MLDDVFSHAIRKGVRIQSLDVRLVNYAPEESSAGIRTSNQYGMIAAVSQSFSQSRSDAASYIQGSGYVTVTPCGRNSFLRLPRRSHVPSP